MKIIVCGGRAYRNQDRVEAVLDDLLRNESIEAMATGGMMGADYLAHKWGIIHDIPVQVFYPDWEKYGKAAGPIRNQTMLDVFKPDLVVAFPGGRGTADITSRAEKAGIQTMRILDG